MSEKNISGITKIAVQGFKSIAEERSIDILPLTLLAGANSSGKSSIMQPFLMLKQTLEADYDPGPLLIDGPNVRFTEASEFLSKFVDGERTDRFHIGIDTVESDNVFSVTPVFRKRREIEIVKMKSEMKSSKDPSVPPQHFIFRPDMSVEELKTLIDKNLVIEKLDVPPEALEMFRLAIHQFLMPNDSNPVKRSRCFLTLASLGGLEKLGIKISFEEGLVDRINLNGGDITVFAQRHIRNSIHIPALRGNPERVYKRTGTGPQYPGTFENYTASLIHKWQEEKDERLEQVIAALRTIGLTDNVRTEKVGDSGIELQVSRLPEIQTDSKDMVSIADVGFGVSQVLPVIVAVIAAEPGQLVYLEQPELHLHPRAQLGLARVLAGAAERGVRIVAETHSSLLLLAIQTLVAEKELSPDLVALHWFSRDKDGMTEVTRGDLDEMGAYGEWPEDFADVDLTAQSNYLNAIDRIRFEKKEKEIS